MIRIWMTPTDLGVLGYTLDVPGVEAIRKRKNGDLILLDGEDGEDVGRVAAGRWDCFTFLEDPPKPRKTTPARKKL